MTILRESWFEAAQNGDVTKLRELLAQGADPNWRDERNQYDRSTAQHDAACLKNEAITRVLIGAGADVNARNAVGCTPLWYACNAGSLEVARVLLDAGADPDLRNDEGHTAYGRVHGDCVELMALMKRVSGASRVDR